MLAEYLNEDGGLPESGTYQCHKYYNIAHANEGIELNDITI
jgi:hypothetical protein